MLDRLEKITGRLANSKAPIEDLVRDYEEAVELMASAQARFEAITGGVPR
jgi:exodeoxyribonuclease VII small subunit